jgi:flagellar L-ring protein FlgH
VKARSVVAIGLALGVAAAAVRADDLYSHESYDALAADHRALRVGDNLTVIVTELTTAAADARTTADKAGAVNGSASWRPTNPKQAAFSINDTFNGGGTIERSGQLKARLTVVVQAVERDGMLRVKGQQIMVINHDRQRLSVEGRVRPQDIAADNTVLSTRLSDAHISYTGAGVLAENERPGLFTRLLSWLRIL